MEDFFNPFKSNGDGVNNKNQKLILGNIETIFLNGMTLENILYGIPVKEEEGNNVEN